MTRGHGWSLTITMRGTFTPCSLPAFTGAFDLTPTLLAWIMLIYIDNILIDRKATSTGFEAKIP